MQNARDVFFLSRVGTPSEDTSSLAHRPATGRDRPLSRSVGRILLIVMLSACSAPAQQSNQDDLGGQSLEVLVKMQVDSVYGATKFLQKAADSASSVTIVAAEEIQRHGYRNLADVLRSVRGFYVINDRNYTYVGVRGLSLPGDYNARILFLLDGHRVNDNIFDGAYVGTEFPVDLDLIDRIEIIRGPASSAYGTGAFAAVINCITKRGRDLNALEASFEAGSWDSYKLRMSYGKRFDNGLEALLSGTFYNSLGHARLFFPEFDSPATNNGIAQNADGDRAYSAFGDVIYRDFNVHLVDESRTKHVPTASFDTVFNDPRNQTTDARRYVDIQYRHSFGSWETLARASYDWYGYHGIYVYDYPGAGIPPFTENYDAANGTWLDFQGDASTTLFQRHKIAFGAEFRRDIRQQQINYDIQPFFLYFDSHNSDRSGAIYFQDKFSVTKKLSFVVGIRSDWYKGYGNALSPRAGLHFALTPATDLKLNYSWAFRSPNDYEAFYSGNNSNTADPLLVDERIRSWELDVEHHFAEWLHLSAAGFSNQIDNLVQQTMDPLTGRPVYLNSPPLHSIGIEYELGVKGPGGLEGSVSHTIQSTRFPGSGEDLPNSPRQLAKFSLGFPLLTKKIFAAFDAQYTSETRTIAQSEIGGFFLLNVTAYSRKITDTVDLSGGLYNLLDRRYANTGALEDREASIPQDGRSFRFKLTYRPFAVSR